MSKILPRLVQNIFYERLAILFCFKALTYKIEMGDNYGRSSMQIPRKKPKLKNGLQPSATDLNLDVSEKILNHDFNYNDSD